MQHSKIARGSEGSDFRLQTCALASQLVSDEADLQLGIIFEHKFGTYGSTLGLNK